MNEYLRDKMCKGFRPQPWYSPTGDSLTLFLKDVPCHAKRVDDLVTFYLDNATKEMVGCKIKGVRALIGKLGDFGDVPPLELACL